jgi:hypothetical protein
MTERKILIEVAGLPDPGDRRELLELILAAASLEVPVNLLLSGNAVDLFCLQSTPAWQQLIDQDLAEVGVPGPWVDTALPPGVAVWDEQQRAKLVRESTVIRA